MSVVPQQTRADMQTVMEFLGVDPSWPNVLGMLRAAADDDLSACEKTFGSMAKFIRQHPAYRINEQIRQKIKEQKKT